MPVSPLLPRLLTNLRRQPYDLRLEVVLADLIAQGFDFDDFVVRPLSLFARRYRRDIESAREERVERWLPVRVVLGVHREGLYDALPQQAFHQPGDPSTRARGVRGMIEDGQAQRRKEKATRRFFLPLEQEFFRFRVFIEQEERRYLPNLSAEWYNRAVARFWGLPYNALPQRVLTNLLYLLPLAYRIVGDLDRTQLCFETVLGQPVRLRTVAPLRHPTPAPAAGGAGGSPAAEGEGVALGRVELGRDLVLGGEYQETLPALEVSVESLSVSELEAYLTNTWQSKALALLCQYFVSFETDVVLRYEIAEESQTFVLAEEGAAEPAVLGYTTGGI